MQAQAQDGDGRRQERDNSAPRAAGSPSQRMPKQSITQGTIAGGVKSSPRFP
jgi:hypothetical protein